LTVASPITSAVAISALESPRATSASTSRSRELSAVSASGTPVAGGGIVTKRSTSRRVTAGASIWSPRATVRTAWTSSSRPTSLSRKPLAPARIAA
jgi:hypothetical protein